MIDNDNKLRDYTDEELCEFLEKNQSTSHRTLAYVCSEILRRSYKLIESRYSHIKEGKK